MCCESLPGSSSDEAAAAVLRKLALLLIMSASTARFLEIKHELEDRETVEEGPRV